MDPNVPTASSLGRALLRLSHARATGTLEVRGGRFRRGGRRARFVLHSGRAVAVDLPGVAPLHEFVDMDLDAHRSMLPELEGRAGPIGQRLVRGGLLPAAGLTHALRRQMRARTIEVFSWPVAEFAFAPIAAAVPTIDRPMSIGDLVAFACRGSLRVPSVVRRRLERATFGLTDRGRHALAESALYPEEMAMHQVLTAQPMLGESLLSVGGGAQRAETALYGWSLVGIVRERSVETSSHRTLLRKRRQLGQADARGLLELDQTTGRSARQNLTRLLCDVHPDKFGPDLQRSSGEVVQALLRAERDLREK